MLHAARSLFSSSLWLKAAASRRWALSTGRGCLWLMAAVATAVGVAVTVPDACAGRAEDLAAIHVEAIGGRERIEALHALRATGRVVSGGKRMRFTMMAARPDKIRLETEMGGRTLVQASDGKNPPWEFDTGDWPPRYRDMAANVARTFAVDAEFDDPLVAGAERGYTFEYAGEFVSEDKKLLRILVTRRLVATFSLLLDPDTFFIVRRVEERKSPLGGTVDVVTFFDDYRPVDGVLIPHRIGLFVSGRIKQQTLIENVQPNPEVADDTFSRPSKITVPTRR